MDWELVSFAKRGHHAKLLSLLKEPKTPTELAKETKLHLSSVSRSLLNLTNKGLVRCLTPKAAHARLYRLSKTGQEVAAKLDHSG